MNKYHIKDDYICRKELIYLDVTTGKDEAQNEVYSFSHNLVKKYNLQKIIDVGCGSGYKLMKYFSNYCTIGIDLKNTIEKVNANYLNKLWITTNFKELNTFFYPDIIISADVIEHLLDPDEMLIWIKNQKPKYIVLSTPDRDSLLSEPTSQTGPPQNIHHVREWSKNEFISYLSSYFIIEHWFNTLQCGYEYTTVLCSLKKEI